MSLNISGVPSSVRAAILHLVSESGRNMRMETELGTGILDYFSGSEIKQTAKV
jgi:hypothetical protein